MITLETREVKDKEAMISPAMEPWNLHRLFLEETARWRPGGYEDAEPSERARWGGPERNRPKGGRTS